MSSLVTNHKAKSTKELERLLTNLDKLVAISLAVPQNLR